MYKFAENLEVDAMIYLYSALIEGKLIVYNIFIHGIKEVYSPGEGYTHGMV